jgi:hypothetical protein
MQDASSSQCACSTLQRLLLNCDTTMHARQPTTSCPTPFTHLPCAACSAFSSNCALQRLVLNCDTTSDAGLAAVSSLSRLRDLTLCEGRAISPWRLVSVVRRLPQLQVCLCWSLWDVGADCCGWFWNAHCVRGMQYRLGGWCLLCGARHSCRHVDVLPQMLGLTVAAGASHSVRGVPCCSGGWCQSCGACHSCRYVDVHTFMSSGCGGWLLLLLS